MPEQILTDNGKVFTARFGPGPGPVLFDRICTDNGIKHILTAPRSPTTTGKVERWHKTLRREFLDGKVFASIDDAQSKLDAWVRHYNVERPHQSIGRVPPIERFRLAEPRDRPAKPLATIVEDERGPVTTRRVSAKGTIGFATVSYKAGAWLAGQTVEVTCEGGLVHIHHRGVLVATHARRHPLDKQTAGVQRPSTAAVTTVGVGHSQGRLLRRASVAPPSAGQVAVGDTVEISVGEQLIRSHKAKHDRTREHGALANPGGRPHRINAA